MPKVDTEKEALNKGNFKEKKQKGEDRKIG